MKGSYPIRRMSCREDYKDSFLFWGLEMLHLTHFTPQQSGRTANLRFYRKVKSLRYKYIERITEILHRVRWVFWVVFFKTSYFAREMPYYILIVGLNVWEKKKDTETLNAIFFWPAFLSVVFLAVFSSKV